jgi:hypothetical protein
MSKHKKQPVRPVYTPPSQVVWSDERLAALDDKQLVTLLENLKVQVESGRVASETAADVEERIKARLPARALTVRRRRAYSEVQLEVRVTEQLGALATDLESRYVLGQPGGAAGKAPRALTDPKGKPRVGSSVKRGNAAIERFIGCRVRDSVAMLAFVLLANAPEERGRYVLLGTDDLLDADPTPNEYTPLAERHGWSSSSRTRMRAVPVGSFAEGAQHFEALLARVAAPLG